MRIETVAPKAIDTFLNNTASLAESTLDVPDIIVKTIHNTPFINVMRDLPIILVSLILSTTQFATVILSLDQYNFLCRIIFESLTAFT